MSRRKQLVESFDYGVREFCKDAGLNPEVSAVLLKEAQATVADALKGLDEAPAQASTSAAPKAEEKAAAAPVTAADAWKGFASQSE
jgi:hypothetical protein